MFAHYGTQRRALVPDNPAGQGSVELCADGHNSQLERATGLAVSAITVKKIVNVTLLDQSKSSVFHYKAKYPPF